MSHNWKSFCVAFEGDDGEGSVVSRQSRRRKERERPFLQGSEQVLRSRPRSASQPPVQFVPCPHVFPFSPAGFVNWAQLGWEKQRKVTVVIKGNRSVLVLPVLWLIPGWQKRNGWISQHGFFWIMWKPSSFWDKQKSRHPFCSCLLACEITSD